MRVAFVAQPFDRLNPPVNGGSLAIWIYQIAKVCARRNVAVVAFDNHGGSIGARRISYENVDYIYTPTAVNRIVNRVVRMTPRGNRIPQFASRWQDYGYARQVGQRTRQLGCDVVLVMNYSQFVPVIRRLNPDCKICLMMHCEWLTQIDPACVAQRLAQTDLVVGCSEYITRKIAEAFPAISGRCVTVPNATVAASEVDTPRDDVPMEVLFVGRVSPEKGIHDLINAFHEVLRRFPDARLRIVGGAGSAPIEYIVGLSNEPNVTALRRFYEADTRSDKDPYLAQLEQLAGSELGRRITFEGRVNYTQTKDFYRHATVLVNPSLSESFGMSLVEAMMHRVPVIATRVGGMPFIVDEGKTGYLVEPADTRALARAICTALANPVHAGKMGEAGRRVAMEKFTWEKSTDLLLKHFQELLKRGSVCR